MDSGRVVQVIPALNGIYIEVVDARHGGIDRSWRCCNAKADIQIGDNIWWHQWEGYLTRDGKFIDVNIGSCKPAAHPVDLGIDPTIP